MARSGAIQAEIGGDELVNGLRLAIVREVIAVVVGFVALVCALHLCTGCRSAQTEPAVIETRAKNAILLEEYGRALAACRALGKDAGSLDVYESCAKAADEKYGVKP